MKYFRNFVMTRAFICEKGNTVINFEFNGKKYREASKHQKEWGLKIISGLMLTGNESVLDLGCGDGFLTKQIADKLPSGYVIGVDASEGMINSAKEYESSNLKFYKMDINEIDYEEAFDLIFSNATLHWVKDHNKLLCSCFKALKSGGCIRFNFAGDGNCSNFYSAIKNTITRKPYNRYFESFEWPWFMPEINEYQIIINSNNFKDIKIWEENADRYFTDKNEMIKWIDQPSIVPFLKYVGETDKESFRIDVINQMIVKTGQPDGTCFETFRRINVFGVK